MKSPSFTPNLSNSVIDNYIQRVTELSQSSQRIPTAEELEKIAADLGIEPEEIQAAQKQSNDHYIRAQGYMKLKHWDDAIAELQEAVAFNPSNLDLLICLSQSHLGRWNESHRREDEENLRLRIRQCLALQPDSEAAYHLLAKLTNSLKWRKYIFLGLALGISGAIAGFATMLWLNDALPYWFQRESKLEQLEQRLLGEIELLRQQQEMLRQELRQIQENSDQQRENRFNTLRDRLERLEKETRILQRKSEQSQPNIIRSPLLQPPSSSPQ